MGMFPSHEFEVVASKLTKQKGATLLRDSLKALSPLRIRWCLSEWTNFYHVAGEMLAKKEGQTCLDEVKEVLISGLKAPSTYQAKACLPAKNGWLSTTITPKVHICVDGRH